MYVFAWVVWATLTYIHTWQHICIVRYLGLIHCREEGCFEKYAPSAIPRADSRGANCRGTPLEWIRVNTGTPSKKCFFHKMWFFVDFPPSTSPWKSCVSAFQNGLSTSSLPPFIVDLIDILRLPKVELFFSMGILVGVKWQTSRAAYNGPKQQWYTNIIPKIRQRFWLHMLIAEPRENIVWDFPPFETDIIFILVSQGEDWSHFRRNLAAKAGTILWIWIASIYIFLTAFGYIQNYERKVFKFCC